MTVRQIAIDWDWGATGIWSIGSSDEPWTPTPGGQWGPYTPPADQDRHRAWRGLLSDELIDALQAWNDRGDEFMGRHAHLHTDHERARFWAEGESLAARTQAQLGSQYDVRCRTPTNFS